MKINNISEEGVWRLVDELARVRADTELARIFHRAIPGNWGLHIATMRDFWSSVTGRYKGNPAAASAHGGDGAAAVRPSAGALQRNVGRATRRLLG
jgi:truncated hemoglobin YjbI